MRGRRPSTWKCLALTVTAAVVTATLPAGTASAAPARRACERRDNNTPVKLLECVTTSGVEGHLAEFARIAAANDDPAGPGSRASGTKGYTASVDYVAGKLRDAGYRVRLDEARVLFQTTELRQLTPTSATYPTAAFVGSGLGKVTGRVIPVDLTLDQPENSTSACTKDDFNGLDFTGPADIALIQRDVCDFTDKVANAEQAGAEAVVIFNQGTPGRLGLEIGGLAGPANVPVVGVGFEEGRALAADDATAYVHVSPIQSRPDVNVIADLPGRNRENVVMAGAHLDSVAEGPGINDNGSGVAALLETALMMANHTPQNSVRFAFWGAEELGVQGSSSYVLSLTPAELDQIALYLNYDMIASPNHVFGVHDGDQQTLPAPYPPVPIPQGSAAIADLYEDYYAAIGESSTAAPLDGRSDYFPFLAFGIPVGGLFTGAEGIKTSDEAAIWGGTAGEPYDSCYHTACDTRVNINRRALEVNSDLIAYAQLSFAYSTESVNGVPGAKMPGGSRWLRGPSTDAVKSRVRTKLDRYADREDLLALIPLHRAR